MMQLSDICLSGFWQLEESWTRHRHCSWRPWIGGHDMWKVGRRDFRILSMWLFADSTGGVTRWDWHVKCPRHCSRVFHCCFSYTWDLCGFSLSTKDTYHDMRRHGCSPFLMAVGHGLEVFGSKVKHFIWQSTQNYRSSVRQIIWMDHVFLSAFACHDWLNLHSRAKTLENLNFSIMRTVPFSYPRFR